MGIPTFGLYSFGHSCHVYQHEYGLHHKVWYQHPTVLWGINHHLHCLIFSTIRQSNFDPEFHRTHGELGGLEDKIRALDGYFESQLPLHDSKCIITTTYFYDDDQSFPRGSWRRRSFFLALFLVIKSPQHVWIFRHIFYLADVPLCRLLASRSSSLMHKILELAMAQYWVIQQETQRGVCWYLWIWPWFPFLLLTHYFCHCYDVRNSCSLCPCFRNAVLLLQVLCRQVQHGFCLQLGV